MTIFDILCMLFMIYFVFLIVISYFPLTAAIIGRTSMLLNIMLLFFVGLGPVLLGCATVTVLIRSYHRIICSLFGL